MAENPPLRILLVEDDPAHAEIVRRNLADFSVANILTHVEDGQAALDYLGWPTAQHPVSERPRPDLILLDLRLPKVDGLEVLHRMKSDPRLREIPTVILTTSQAESDVLAAYRDGAGSYLVKPVEFAKFTALLEAFGLYWLGCNQFPPIRRTSPERPAAGS